MRKFLFVICILYFAVISGCDSLEEQNEKKVQEHEDITLSENLFDEDGFSNEQISLGFGYKNDNGIVFENENNKINAEIYIEGGDYEVEVGILVFVNGILQPVSVEREEEKNLNIYKNKGKTTYNVSFDIISGTEGEQVRVDTISLLNPSFKVTEKTKSFGLCFASSSILPCWLECKTSVNSEEGASDFELTELSDEVKEKFIISMSNGSVTNHLEGVMNIQYFQNGEEVNKLKVNDNMLEFNMDIYGGKGEKYNLYVFLNNDVLPCFDGKEYNKVTVTSEKTTKVSVKADLSDKNIGEYTQLFAVAVPVGEVKDRDTEVYKLSNIVVDNSLSGEEK